MVTAVSYASGLGPYFKIVAHEGGRQEIAVNVYNNQMQVRGFHRTPMESLEIIDFGQVHEYEIDIVVKVSEHVYVAETYLYRQTVAERMGRRRHAGIVRR